MTLKINITECKFCEKKFVSDIVANKHTCMYKTRHEFSKTTKGMAALSYYEKWLALSSRRCHGINTFIHSKFYKSFVDFIDYANTMGIPDKNLYIKIMHKHNILPNLWCNDQIYNYFIEIFDEIMSPLDMTKISIKTLYDLSNILDCTIDNVFTNITAIDIIRLIEARRFSPWLLLLSKKFYEFMEIQLSEIDNLLLQSVINPKSWQQTFKENPKNVQLIRAFVKEMGI